MEPMYYTSTSTALGDVGIAWRRKDYVATIVRIFLPAHDERLDDLIRRSFPGATRQSHTMTKQLCRSIQGLAEGRDVTCSENILDMKICGEFQRRV